MKIIDTTRTYTMPITTSVPTVMGAGVVKRTGSTLKSAGKKKAAVICDKGIEKTGIVQKVIDSVVEAGLEYAVFNEVTPDPDDVLVDKAAAFVVANGCDSLIAVGGGGPMDTAKATSVVAVNEGTAAEFCAKKAAAVNPNMYCIAIPTTAGTGSENSQTAIISMSQAGHIKGGISPSYVSMTLIDPELTLGLPRHITANTGMDALSHCVEAILASSRDMLGVNPFIDTIAEKAIRIINEYLPKACADGSDLEARMNMCFAASVGGMCVVETMFTLGHPIAHAMAPLFHVPHGAACAVALPQAVRFLGAHYPERIKLLADCLDVPFTDDMSAEEIAKVVSDKIKKMNRELGNKSYKELGLTEEDIDTLAGRLETDIVITRFGEFPMTKDQIKALIMEDYEG